jgi:hypothetical protein
MSPILRIIALFGALLGNAYSASASLSPTIRNGTVSLTTYNGSGCTG